MRALRALLFYIIAVFIGGALLAPLLYWFAQHFTDAAPKLAAAPFHRYINRSIEGIALIGLWPLVKNLGFNSPAEVGIVWPGGQWKKLGAGFLLGFVSLAIVAVLAFAFHARVMNHHYSGGQIAGKLLGAAGAAIAVTAVEELLFRGALFGALRKALHWMVALVLSSMFFAIMHYFESAQDPETVTWLSGLQLLPSLFRNLGDPHVIFPGFLNLTLVGMLLAWAYQRTGNLYFPIGLHIGWVFWMQTYGNFTRFAPGADRLLWGSGRLTIVNGWIALPILCATLLAFVWKTSNTARTSNTQ